MSPLACLATAAVLAAHLSAQTITPGTLLVATPRTTDPAFTKTVVLLIYADRDAALGLILNRPIDKGWQGGPVPLGTHALIRATARPPESQRILPGVFVIKDPTRIAQLTTGEFRVYRGTCGWTIEQLNEERHAGKWRIIPGRADIIFDPKPETLWQRLLK